MTKIAWKIEKIQKVMTKNAWKIWKMERNDKEYLEYMKDRK